MAFGQSAFANCKLTHPSTAGSRRLPHTNYILVDS